MNMVMVLLVVIVLSVNSVLGDESHDCKCNIGIESVSDASVEDGVDCLASDVPPPGNALHRIADCLKDIYPMFGRQMNMSYSSEERQAIFKTYCENKPLTRCLTNIKPYMKRCQNETVRTSIRALTESMEAVLEVACINHGEKTAIVFEEYLNFSEKQKQVERDCFVATPVDGQLTPDKHMVYGFSFLRNGKLCLSEKGVGVFSSINEMLSIIEDILSKMKCVNPNDHTVILCSKIMPL